MWEGLSWSWWYGSWIYNYLCNQCLSPLNLCIFITRQKISPIWNRCSLWPWDMKKNLEYLNQVQFKFYSLLLPCFLPFLTVALVHLTPLLVLKIKPHNCRKNMSSTPRAHQIRRSEQLLRLGFNKIAQFLSISEVFQVRIFFTNNHTFSSIFT